MRDRPRWDLFPLPVEIPGALLFFIISSITESIVAFYGAAGLLVVSYIAYLQFSESQRREFENRIITLSASP